LQGGKPIEQLQRELKARGEQPPVYVPDIAATVKRTSLVRAGGGKGIPRPDAALKQNHGILFLTARLALHPEVLDEAFMRTVRTYAHGAIHDALIENAVRIPVGHGLPSGYTFIRQHPAERILHTEQAAGDVGERLDALAPKGGGEGFARLVTGQ